MHTETHIYHHDRLELHGYLACPDQTHGTLPAVIVAHDWSGCNDFARKKAEMLAEMGYVGFALDMYGQGRNGNTVEEKQALMQPLLTDRCLLETRIRAAFDAVLSLPQVDGTRVAAIGFCFGGLCVLDLARSGASIKGVVSFHGLLHRPAELSIQPISASVLALHGYDDPMVPPDVLDQFCQEMTQAGADWQVYQYGHTQHAFTNPEAHDQAMGTVYNALTEKRALQSMKNFLQELMNKE